MRADMFITVALLLVQLTAFAGEVMPKLIILNKEDARKLYSAISKGELENVRALLESHPEWINSRMDSNTPLPLAAYYGHLDIVKYLLEKGAPINEPDGNGQIAIWTACRHPEVFKILVEKGGDLKFKSGGWSLLQHAVEECCKPVVELLISKGADVNAQDGELSTPLHKTSRKDIEESVSIAELLINSGANIDATDGDKRTTAHLAADHGCVKLMKLLISKKANLGLKTWNRLTALDIAKERKNEEIIRILTNTGAGK